MFEKHFKDLLVSLLGSYIEDFSEQDIQISGWSGLVTKENMVVKKTALQSIFRRTVGAPVNVVTGFVRKIKVTIPWNEILSKPVEISMDDVHVIANSPAKFDKHFAKKTNHISKMAQFQHLLRQFKAQQQQAEDGENDDAHAEEQESYFKRLTSIIKQNLKLYVNNVHLRFEDTNVSRRDKSFNWAVTVDQVIYSYTNSKFERVFLNIDDRKREKRSFSMLEFKQLALYWNTNVHENWSQNQEFVNLDCLKTMDFSKKYVDNLKRKYQQQQQNYHQIYLIQPLNFTAKWRQNLNQKMQPFVPLSTDNYDIDQLLITIDEEIYKDIQYLMRFWSWHSTATKKNMKHYKFRPAFNVPVKGNTGLYWRYAITATIYYLRQAKKQQNKEVKSKEQRIMIELSELYKILQFNQWVEDTYSANQFKEHQIFTVQINEPFVRTYSLSNTQAVQNQIYKLECKLSPKDILVAFVKAEKQCKELIEEEKAKSGWGNWVKTSISSGISTGVQSLGGIMGYGKTNEEDQDALAQNSGWNSQEEINQIMKKLEEFEASDAGSANLEHDPKSTRTSSNPYEILSDHITVTIPVLQFSLVNKSMHQHGSKQFMNIIIQDFFVQKVKANKDDYQSTLLSIKNFEIVDRLLNQQKFSRMIQKKEPTNNPFQDRQFGHLRTNVINQTIRSHIQRQKDYMDKESLSEIEEEANPNINNGMVQLTDYNILKSSLDSKQSFFLVFQLAQKNIKRQDSDSRGMAIIRQCNVDLMITNIQLFYNRTLLQRVQSFVNQARLHKIQNASAEADFDEKFEKIRQDTQEQVTEILGQSEINVNCNIKSIELLFPDNTNYEMSKFLILQTGDIHLKSGETKRLNLYFNQNNKIDKQVQFQFQNKINQYKNEIGESINTKVMSFQTPEKENQSDKYSFMVYDLKVLYIPTVDQLENFLYHDTVMADIDQKHSILKRMDIILESHSLRVLQEEEQKEPYSALIAEPRVPNKKQLHYDHYKIGIPNVDICLTNKEIQQLKDFVDNTVKYHEQIAFEVQKELIQIHKLNFRNALIDRFTELKPYTKSAAEDEISDSNDQTHSMRPRRNSMMGEVLSQMQNSMTLRERRQSHELGPRSTRETRSRQGRYETLQTDEELYQSAGGDDSNREYRSQDGNPELAQRRRSDGSGGSQNDDEFQDARDYFDPDLIQQINQLKDEDSDEEHAEQQIEFQKYKAQQKSKRNMMVSLCMPKFKLSILEAQDFEKEFLRGINKRIGDKFARQHQLFELDMKLKGTPFLEFDIIKTNFRMLQQSQVQLIAYFIKEISLIDVEKLREPKEIFVSANKHLMSGYDSQLKGSYDENDPENPYFRRQRTNKRTIQDPEEEDQIPIDKNFINDFDGEDQDEQFMELYSINIPNIQKTQIQIGQTDIELNDNLIRKLYESIFRDMPETTVSKYQEVARKQELNLKSLQPITQIENTIDLKVSKINIVLKDKKHFLQIKLKRMMMRQCKLSQEEKELINFKLQDFQLIQDDYEIILKHCSNLCNNLKISFSQNDSNQFEDDIEEANMSANIIEFSQIIDKINKTKKQEVTINDFLSMFDIKRIYRIVQINKSFENTIKNIQQQQSKNMSRQKEEQQIQIQQQKEEILFNQNEFSIKINESFFQLPVKEGKNSLFFVIEDFYTETINNQVSGDKTMNVKDTLLQIYVSQQFDQAERYNLISLCGSNIQSLNGSHDISINQILINLNENYIFFLSKLVDENFQDAIRLMNELKSNKDDPQYQQALNEERIRQEQTQFNGARNNQSSSHETEKQYYFEKLFQNQPESIKQILLLNKIPPGKLQTLHEQMPIDQASVQNIKIQSFKILWVFDQNFDDHQDQFFTLNNRNYTKMMLEKLDNEAAANQLNKEKDSKSGSIIYNPKKRSIKDEDEQIDSASIPQPQVSVTSPGAVKDSGSQLLFHNLNQKKQRHQQITLELTDILFQSMKAVVYQDEEGEQVQTKINSQIFKVNEFNFEYRNTHNQTFQIMQIRPASNQNLEQNNSIQCLMGTDLISKIGIVDVKISQQNVNIVSVFAKRLYSCKNVVQKKGRKQFLSEIFAQDQQKIEDKEEMDKITRLDIQNIRIIIFDSTEIEKEAKKTSNIKLSEAPSFPNYSPPRPNLQHLGANPGNPMASEYNNLIDQIILEEKYEENEGTPPGSPLFSPRGKRDLDHCSSSGQFENEENKKFFNDQFKPNLFSFDSIASRSAFIINFQVSCLITSNQKVIQSQYDQDLLNHGLNKIKMIKIKNFEIYQNGFSTNLRKLSIVQGLEKNADLYETESQLYKATILHPTNILLKVSAYVQEMDFPTKSQYDIDISTIEIEISLKQIFKIKLLAEKINEKLTSIKQVLDHLQKKNVRSSESYEYKNQKITHNQWFLRLTQLYVTIIKEIGESSILGAHGQSVSDLLGIEDAGQSENYLMSQFAPIMSFEAKNIKFKQQKHSDSSVNKLKLQFPIEIHYFNPNLNFFEPFIEQTTIELAIDSSKLSTDHKNNIQQTKIEFKELLNVNFSVSFYDMIFNLISTLNQEQLIYDQMKQSYQQQQQSSLSQSQKNLKKQQSTAGGQYQPGYDPVYAASSYFIKNSTGEILLFKTISQKAFQEIQADEEYPLDFQTIQNFRGNSTKNKNNIKKNDSNQKLIN